MRPAYRKPDIEILDVPRWFNTTANEVDVSIVIPLYRSAHEISYQISKWDNLADNLVKEIIYVSDGCPQHSHNMVLQSWERKQPIQGIGSILLLSNNAGFATACNAGASQARGKYLLFLNADTTVTPNWIEPMYALAEMPNVGIVGNLQLRHGDMIDSAGSQWMWDSKSFEHIGRDVYHGNRIRHPMFLKESPQDLLEPAERDMVTGCCFLIRKSLFDEMGGFDVGYRVGYWEDADLNMQVKSRGYKVYYQPKSVIYHLGGHSQSGLHPFILDNQRRFYERWVDTKRIDALVKNPRGTLH